MSDGRIAAPGSPAPAVTPVDGSPPVADGALVARAVNYLHAVLPAVTPLSMARRTPCRGWDVRELLTHTNASLDILGEALTDSWRDGGTADPDQRAADTDPLIAIPRLPHVLRAHAHRLVEVWTRLDRVLRTGVSESRGGEWEIPIADRRLSCTSLAGIGAIEIAVHGWDLSVACGQRCQLPFDLAHDLLEVARIVVTEDQRPELFDHPIAVPSTAAPGDRLVAYLGRNPNR